MKHPDAAGRSAARSSYRGLAGQAGLTLIEMVVTLAIISIGVVGIVYGFSAVVRGAGDAQEQAVLDGGLQAAADYVQSSQVAYVRCAGAHTYTLPSSPSYLGPSPPAGLIWSEKVSESSGTSGLSYLPGTVDSQGNTLPATCPGGEDWGVQEIRITASWRSSSVSRVAWKDDPL